MKKLITAAITAAAVIGLSSVPSNANCLSYLKPWSGGSGVSGFMVYVNGWGWYIMASTDVNYGSVYQAAGIAGLNHLDVTPADWGGAPIWGYARLAELELHFTQCVE